MPSRILVIFKHLHTDTCLFDVLFDKILFSIAYNLLLCRELADGVWKQKTSQNVNCLEIDAYFRWENVRDWSRSNHEPLRSNNNWTTETSSVQWWRWTGDEWFLLGGASGAPNWRWGVGRWPRLCVLPHSRPPVPWASNKEYDRNLIYSRHFAH